MSECMRCGEETKESGGEVSVGIKQAPFLFEDGNGYTNIGTICEECMYKLESWVRGNAEEETKIRVCIE
jgi:hypothetical protein